MSKTTCSLSRTKNEHPKKIIQTHKTEIKLTVHPIGSSEFIQFEMIGKGIIQEILAAYRVKIWSKKMIKIVAKTIAPINSVKKKNLIFNLFSN